jgi:glycosyltransferase involved in cell wall biosynthesis
MNTTERSKRILVIAPTPFFADRGCHVRILEESRTVIALGHHVTICTYHIGNDVDRLEIRRSLRVPWYSKLSAGPSVHKFYVDLFLLCTVLRVCLRRRPDIIHAHLHEGVAIGKIASVLFGIPLVADLQGSLTGELLQHRFMRKGGLLHRILQWVERVIMRMPDVTLTSSSNTLHPAPDEAGEIAAKIRVLADGVDTERFHPSYPVDGISAALGIPRGVKVIGFLGTLTDYQGVAVLLQAVPHVLEAMKPVHFLIMGYPNVEHYREQARLLGVAEHVTFTGRVPYGEAPRYLAVCDVTVSPKLLSTESNGKLLNYMAMGRPIVASDTPVNREILGDLGVYAEVGNPVALAEALLKVLLDDEGARKLGIRLRQKAMAEYSWQSVGERITETYRQLTDSFATGKPA